MDFPSGTGAPASPVGQEAEDQQGSRCGIFWHEPHDHDVHIFRKSIFMGHTSLASWEVDQVLEEMQDEWQALSYDLLRKNCVHFADKFCQLLGVGPIPEEIRWLCTATATGVDAIKGLQRRASMIWETLTTTEVEEESQSLSSSPVLGMMPVEGGADLGRSPEGRQRGL